MVAAAEAPAVPGSLWDEREARRLLGYDFNARQTGDLVTVFINEETATSLDADTSTSRKSGISANISALFGLENTLAAAFPKTGGTVGIGTETETSFAGAGSTGRGSSVYATVTCEVIEVMAAGNLRIWGYKQVMVNREVQYVVLSGIIRQRDIAMNNTILADRIAQASIEVTGRGVIADKQGPGIVHRVFDAIWPF